MTAFTTLSHGTQDLYPTFLQDQHGLPTKVTGTITLLMNLGAICGALAFGLLSHRLGRQRTIIAAAVLAAPVIPLWAYGDGVAQLAVGAVLMQFAVQGAWSMVPAYLNELSPFAIRATFPGVVYQLGNLVSSRNVVFQADLAASRGGDYAFALAVVAGITVAVLVGCTTFGPHPQDVMS
jgi:SHS family lactate transporter-like MFS transporter